MHQRGIVSQLSLCVLLVLYPYHNTNNSSTLTPQGSNQSVNSQYMDSNHIFEALRQKRQSSQISSVPRNDEPALTSSASALPLRSSYPTAGNNAQHPPAPYNQSNGSRSAPTRSNQPALNQNNSSNNNNGGLSYATLLNLHQPGSYSNNDHLSEPINEQVSAN
jgi:hypothetical protein